MGARKADRESFYGPLCTASWSIRLAEGSCGLLLAHGETMSTVDMGMHEIAAGTPPRSD